MKNECDVIRDLLPLYADDACSEGSRELVEDHLPNCPGCREMLQSLRQTEIENDLKNEKNEVIQYGIRQFRRRTAAVGSALSGSVLVPLLICLYIYFVFGTIPGWFYIVLASLCVAASLTVVPLTVSEDKLFWTVCAFCVSVLLLFAVICLCTGGNWFWIASSATMFGLAAVSLPFLVRARPAKKLIGSRNRLMVILGVDAALFANMMNSIFSYGKTAVLFRRGILVLLVLIAYEVFFAKNEKKTGI